MPTLPSTAREEASTNARYSESPSLPKKMNGDSCASSTGALCPSPALCTSSRVRTPSRRMFLNALTRLRFADLDRTNLGNARLQGLPQDVLHGDPTGVLFDWVNSAFFFSYVSAVRPIRVLHSPHTPHAPHSPHSPHSPHPPPIATAQATNSLESSGKAFILVPAELAATDESPVTNILTDLALFLADPLPNTRYRDLQALPASHLVGVCRHRVGLVLRSHGTAVRCFAS